jgi:hypothetical protein
MPSVGELWLKILEVLAVAVYNFEAQASLHHVF